MGVCPSNDGFTDKEIKNRVTLLTGPSVGGVYEGWGPLGHPS